MGERSQWEGPWQVPLEWGTVQETEHATQRAWEYGVLFRKQVLGGTGEGEIQRQRRGRKREGEEGKEERERARVRLGVGGACLSFKGIDLSCLVTGKASIILTVRFLIPTPQSYSI